LPFWTLKLAPEVGFVAFVCQFQYFFIRILEQNKYKTAYSHTSKLNNLLTLTLTVFSDIKPQNFTLEDINGTKRLVLLYFKFIGIKFIFGQHFGFGLRCAKREANSFSVCLKLRHGWTVAGMQNIKLI
jgi:hypothetical protein